MGWPHQLQTIKARANQKKGYGLRVTGADVEVGDRVLVKVVAFDGKHKLADKWEEAVYWRNVLDSIIIIKKRKEKPTGGGTPGTGTRYANR